MALTLEAEQRLEKAKLVEFFNAQKSDWQKVAQEAYSYVEKSFPTGATIRQDDVAKTLLPAIEVSQTLQARLDVSKLKQKFWKRFFTDLIIDRTWSEISKAKDATS